MFFGLCDVAGQSRYLRNVVNLEHIMDAPSDEDVRTLVESARGEALSEHRRRDLVANWDPSAPIFGLKNDLMCLRVDCCHESMVSHRGVARLSRQPRFHTSVRLLCP